MTKYTADYKEFLIESGGLKVSGHVFGDQTFRKNIIYFHGLPGSSFEAMLLHAAAKERGLTVISPDRPGIGNSSPQPARCVSDFRTQIELILDHFKIQSFASLGISGGTPYALTAQLFFKELVSSVIIVSGTAPFSGSEKDPGMNWFYRLVIRLGRQRPRLTEALLSLYLRLFRRFPSLGILFYTATLSEPDKLALKKPGVAKVFIKNLKRALGAGPDGAVKDFLLLVSDWRIDLSKISLNVQIWHATDDRLLPFDRAVLLSRLIPQNELYRIDGEGHFMAINHVGEILDRLSELSGFSKAAETKPIRIVP